MEEEAAPFRKIAAGHAASAQADILLTGIGRQNAEKSLREFLNSCRSRGDETQIKEKLETPHVVSYEPDLVLTCGFAGGLNPDLKLGDVIFEMPLTPSLSPSDGERVADRPGEGSLIPKLLASGAKPAKFFLRRPHRHHCRRKEKIVRRNRRGRRRDGIGGDPRRLSRARNPLRHRPRDFRPQPMKICRWISTRFPSRTRIWTTANYFWPSPNRPEKSAR